MKKISILVLFFAVFLLGACAKVTLTTPSNTETLTPKDHLVNGEWISTQIIVGGTDIFPKLNVCNIDDKTKFIYYGDVLFDRTDVLCVNQVTGQVEDKDPKVILWTWELSDDFKKLTYTRLLNKNQKILFDVKELTEQKLVIGYKDSLQLAFSKK